ncbi:TPA: molybdate ABC transporter substrate-binding protein [Pasteurella multocida]|uniref:molybdate ABC transporter substrate-binding protein n=1 Tax=Pasteurella multocida TaxID=747 RepID=UPI0029448B36|nr:molybdate ABC transporter substrate-binding protein [Pasteurella multocida]MEB3479021.1 molybdate ABC transporter substrate-binding protein [Pasteurella multocida]MEB3493532.1 molybdate ABC transporter substrate-binding protein [Pasteurella multocida]HDR1130853.1 molybdate ABC transporter substrate-binding protein [Pasteurella multocida]HDR1816701.1 molybdate ABC transporter substrate-binding protein [Pasteurella multocida]HED4470528.1 molybdate ABC transporter substrate-binding protein [Pa
MKKLIVLSSLLTAAFAAQAAELYLYAGAGLKDPVEKIVKQFEKETGNNVTIEYGGSGQLLARYNTVKTGDLYLPGSSDYVEKLEKTGDVKASAPLVLHIPVMAIRKEKSAGIDSFKALAESNLRLGIGDSKAMALGKGAEKMLELSGYQAQLNDKIVVKAATVKQLMLYLLNGDVDAAVVGRSGAWKVRDKVDLLPNPADTPEEKVTIALLASTKHPKEAKQLLDLFNSEQGVKYFVDEGFLPIK